MADLEMSQFADDERPIALRKKRRNSAGVNTRSRSNSQTSVLLPHGISTPPATPKRAKKRVRFSDPGPAIEHDESVPSGLTPFIRRTSLSTPTSKRRHSTPANLWNRAQYDAPLSGTLHFEPLRQVLDGRVKRRLRRNRLSEEVNTIEWDKRHEAKSRRLELARLRQEVEEKDLEMQSMRDEQELASQLEGESGLALSGNATLTTKVQELQQQIEELKAALRDKESAAMDDPNWTMAARGPFNLDDDDDMMITNYDQDFRDSMMNDELMTTPTRLNTSFPSPPSTTPNTPCKSTATISAGIQTSFSIPDPEKDTLKSQLESLQSEVSKLRATIALNEDNYSRLGGKLSEYLPVDESHGHSSLDSALDTVLTQLALSQSQAQEQSIAFVALGTEITALGFSSCSGPEETLETIKTQFRQARLELEYLTPGEVVEGFENEKLLEMLVSRIRILLQRVNEGDESIDQYHEQELSLRQQLNTRVDALQDVQKELYLATSVVGDLRSEIQEKEVGNERLQTALQGYRDEVCGLESLVERMEREEVLRVEMLKGEVKDVEERLQSEVLRHDTTRASDEGKDIIIMELEKRLNAALHAAAEVQDQMATFAAVNSTLAAEKNSTIQQLKSTSTERERAHGDALALRDARVSELRGEIERVNEALKTAHTTILALRKENKKLAAQAEDEKERGQSVVQAMREQLNRVMETGTGYIDARDSVSQLDRVGDTSAGGSLTAPQAQVVSRRGTFFDGDLARRSSKKRRRYDSGLGFLGEEEEGGVNVEV